MNFPHYIADQFSHNQFLTGAIGGGLVAYLLAQVRSVPSRLMTLFLDQFSVHLTVHGEDGFGPELAMYLSEHPWIKRSRKIGVHSNWVGGGMIGSARYKFALTAGPGMHIIRVNKKFIWLNWSEEKSTGGGGDSGGVRIITITLRALGRDRKVFEDLIEACQKLQDQDKRIKVLGWTTNGAFEELGRRVPRSMETVFIDPAMRDSMVRDVRAFLDGPEWYADHGVPHRRGYLLEGPPGTGKTTLIFALASLLEKDLYIINPNSITTDSALMSAFQQASEGIVVIEDLDAVRVALERDPDLVTASKEYRQLAPGRAPRKMLDPALVEKANVATFGITLSGLLNAIDGLGAGEGRILIVTSNHPENLDRALMRPGRIDKRFHVGPIDGPLAIAMCKHFLGEEAGQQYFNAHVQAKLPIVPAALQNDLLMTLAAEDDKIVPIRGESDGHLHQPHQPTSAPRPRPIPRRLLKGSFKGLGDAIDRLAED